MSEEITVKRFPSWRAFRVVALLSICGVQMSPPRCGSARAGQADVTEPKTVEMLVVDPEGHPIPGLAFSLVAVPQAKEIGSGGASDPEGRFRVRMAAGVSYELRFSPSLDAPFSGTETVSIPQPWRENQAPPLKVVARRCLRVAGKVVDSQDRPVPAIRVFCSSQDRRGNRTAEESSTDASGRFVIPLVSGGPPYVVYGRSEGYLVKEMPLPVDQAQNVLLRAVKAETITVACRLVTDKAGAEEALPYTGGCSITGPVGYMTQVTQGVFDLPKLVPGKYVLSVGGLATEGLHVTNPSFAVERETRAIKFVVATIPATAITVTDQVSGKGVPQARILVAETGQLFLTDAEGRVSIRVPGAHISVRVTHRDYVSTSVAKVPVGNKMEVKIEPAFRAELRGRVVHAQGEPIEGAEVIAFIPGRGEVRAISDKAGEFTLPGLRGNKAKVICRAEGLAPVAWLVDLPTREPATVRLLPGVTVTLAVKQTVAAFSGEKICEGRILVLDEASGAIQGVIAPQGGAEQKQQLRLNPGRYVALWLGKKAGFLIAVIEAQSSVPVAIDIREPERKNIISPAEISRILWSAGRPAWP